MEQKYIQQVAGKLNITTKQVSSIHQLQSEGATIPFMARYRKEVTGNLDEVVIGNVVEEIQYFNELDKRKETVIKTIEEQGKLTPELKKELMIVSAPQNWRTFIFHTNPNVKQEQPRLSKKVWSRWQKSSLNRNCSI